MSKYLGDILQECDAIKFGDFTFTSGRKSKYYIDVKKASTKPEILEIICECIVKTINDNDISADYVACVELGGVPIGTLVSFLTGLPLLIIRKTDKDHGLNDKIIGDHDKKKIALFVEDVTTTGGSVINAVHIIRDEGLIVRNVISVVDWEEGAENSLREEGLNLIALVNARKLLDTYEARKQEENIVSLIN